MVEAVLSVRWKDHGCELAAEYRSLLENNFLVDCTLSAEGQSVKAHRLVLSACSPYFHMLFQEETGKHPFVILLNASFEMLKAVIDFVYRGETHIPEGNLKAFLTLAQSLQIKGLNVFTQDNKNKNQSSNATENGPQESDETNQITSEVRDIDTSLEMNLENYSQQHRHHTDDYSDAVHTNSSVPIQPFSASCEKVQSATLMTSLPEHQHLSYDEVSTKSEITVKHESLCQVFSENRNEILDNVQSHEPRSANFRREMDLVTASECGEEDSNRFSSCHKSTCGDEESSLMPSAEQQFVESNNEVSFGGDPVESGDPYRLAGVVPKREHLDDEEGEDPLDDRDMPLTDMTETNEGMEPAYCEQNPGQCSSADGLPLEEDLATLQRSLPGQQSESSPPHTELQLHEAPHAHPGGQTVLSDEGEIAVNPLPSTSTQKPRRTRKTLHSCEICEKTFTCRSHLSRHERRHKGERPYRCDVCNRSFSESYCLREQMRCHTGERPYSCDVCGADDLPLEEDLATQRRSLPGQQSESSPPHTELQLHEGPHAHPGEQTELSGEGEMAVNPLPSTSTQKPRRMGKQLHSCETCEKTFTYPSDLARHERVHKGERPYYCDACGRNFSESGSLRKHMRCHTGERPYRCDVCDRNFSESGSLRKHMRCHTGERPYSCDVCGKTFTQSGSLHKHRRCHTGERPYACDVCGKRFIQSSSLVAHNRCHTGERPYRCDVCETNFFSSSALVYHMRTHTGERPFRCAVCEKNFLCKSHLANHIRSHTGERPYRCDVCGEEFIQKSHLSNHMRKHVQQRT